MKISYWSRRDTRWCVVWEKRVIEAQVVMYDGGTPIAWLLPNLNVLHARGQPVGNGARS